MDIHDKSTLTYKFVSLLKNPDIKIVSFDIFDTLASRDVREPKDIFFLVGKHKKVRDIFDTPEYFQFLRIQAERQARIHSKCEEITLSEIYDKLPITKEQANDIMEIELQTEKSNLHINKQIYDWIKLAKKENKKVILISDMYLGKKQLTKLILNKIKNKKLIDYVYISSEYKKTKHQGSLFTKVLKLETIKAKNLLHIGDNKKADVEVPLDFGIKTIYYNFDNYLHTVSSWESNYLPRPIYKGYCHRKWASMLNPYENEKQQFFYDEGAFVFGPILWEFSKWVEKLACKNSVDKIFCIMREGRIFKKCLDMINPKLNTALFYASRKSTYLATFDIERGVDFYTFRKFSIKNFYELFRLKLSNKLLEKHENTLIEVANQYYVNEKNLIDIISDDFSKNMKKIKKTVAQEREKFKEYYKQMGGSSNSMIIDFGGRGTIVKNINNILDKKNIKPKITVLFYMNQNGYEITQGLNILPFINLSQKKIDSITRSPHSIEILFNGTKQTTISYEKAENEIVPKTKFPNINLEELKPSIKAFDNGIEKFFYVCKTDKAKFERKLLSELFIRIIDIPHAKEAKFLGELLHDEGYGSEHIEPIVKNRDLDTIKNIGLENFYFKFRSNPTYMSKQIFWPQGCMALIDNNFLAKINSLYTQSISAIQINQLLATIDENPEISSLFIYGAGDFGKECFEELIQNSIDIKGIIDSKAELKEFKFKNFTVKTLPNSSIEDNDTILIASGTFAIEITDFIQKNINKKINIINHYNGLVKI